MVSHNLETCVNVGEKKKTQKSMEVHTQHNARLNIY